MSTPFGYLFSRKRGAFFGFSSPQKAPILWGFWREIPLFSEGSFAVSFTKSLHLEARFLQGKGVVRRFLEARDRPLAVKTGAVFLGVGVEKGALFPLAVLLKQGARGKGTHALSLPNGQDEQDLSLPQRIERGASILLPTQGETRDRATGGGEAWEAIARRM